MIIIDNPSLIETFIDKPLTPSDWFEVTQKKIDEFAKSTGDFQWIHVDIEKAKKEMPNGKTIAHGYFRKNKKVNLKENGGYRVINNYEMEIDGKEKPAFVAETISLVFP